MAKKQKQTKKTIQKIKSIIILSILIILSKKIVATSIEEKLINPETQKEAIKEIWEKKEKAIPELKNMLLNRNKELREIAIIRLGELNNKEVIPELIELLEKEPEIEIRVKIIQFFIKLKSAEALELLQKRVLDASIPEDRMAAIIGIGNIINTEEINTKIIETYKRALKDNAGIVRMRAAYFLAKAGYENGYEISINDIKNENALVREYAVEALGEMYDIVDNLKQNEIKNLISKAEEDKEAWVKIKAKIAKEKLELVGTIEKIRTTGTGSRETGLKKRISRKAMSINKDAIKSKTDKLREILNSDKILDIKIWAANEMLDMGEEGKKVAEEIIKSNESGSYVMRKELTRKKRE